MAIPRIRLNRRRGYWRPMLNIARGISLTRTIDMIDTRAVNVYSPQQKAFATIRTRHVQMFWLLGFTMNICLNVKVEACAHRRRTRSVGGIERGKYGLSFKVLVERAASFAHMFNL